MIDNDPAFEVRPAPTPEQQAAAEARVQSRGYVGYSHAGNLGLTLAPAYG